MRLIRGGPIALLEGEKAAAANSDTRHFIVVVERDGLFRARLGATKMGREGYVRIQE